MALLEKHRSAIYAHFVETIGEEAAQAMLAQFPVRDLDEPVTREFVRAEIAGVRAEIAGLRGEVGADIAGLRGEAHAEFAEVREEMASIGQGLAIRLQVTIGLAVTVLSAVTLITR